MNHALCITNPRPFISAITMPRAVITIGRTPTMAVTMVMDTSITSTVGKAIIAETADINLLPKAASSGLFVMLMP